MKDVLLITPPFTQLNTPYPATTYLKGFLNTKNITSFQMDLGLEVILRMFSKGGLEDIFNQVQKNEQLSSNALRILGLKYTYLKTIDQVIAFLQGHQASMARQICSGSFLPQASRFDQLEDLDWLFGNMGMQDRAKHLATLYLEDLSDFIKECVDPNFGFSRYAERLGRSANSFDEIYSALNSELSFIDQITIDCLKTRIEKDQSKLICISVPFPGNLFSAFRCAQFVKSHYPQIKIAMGGGFPNTELRSLKDPRVFEFFDFITLDDGELPVELLVKHVTNQSNEFKRTFLFQNNTVQYVNNSNQHDYKQKDLGTPDYSDLLLDQYISVIEVANPMHSLWSDGRWNKLTMAHGCYWGKCTFCDISLDYIGLYEPLTASLLVDRMEEMIRQTQFNGFHFVDEAAPPALMRELALEILRRDLCVTWWTNIRFEKSFTKDLCVLLKKSGCIAVSGGLEVASDRLLELIDKGVSVAQVAEVTSNLSESGIMVHAYLMYGYPSQTIQETVDSLEMVRQLFELGIVQSGFWHQFALTAHSPVGKHPEKYGIIPIIKDIEFANNDIEFKDSTSIDHAQFSYGLKKSLYNYMHGLCFEFPLQEWFDFKIPHTIVSPDYIANVLDRVQTQYSANAKLLWLGSFDSLQHEESIEILLRSEENEAAIQINIELGKWLCEWLHDSNIHSNNLTLLNDFKTDYQSKFKNFDGFWYSEELETIKSFGLLVI